MTTITINLYNIVIIANSFNRDRTEVWDSYNNNSVRFFLCLLNVILILLQSNTTYNGRSEGDGGSSEGDDFRSEGDHMEPDRGSENHRMTYCK